MSMKKMDIKLADYTHHSLRLICSPNAYIKEMFNDLISPYGTPLGLAILVSGVLGNTDS